MNQNQNIKTAGTTDVVGFLKGQHEQIKGLFEKVIAAQGEERGKVFGQLKMLMQAHEAAEEKVVHPAAKRALPGGEAEVAARLKEETEAKEALSTLERLDVSSSEFETKIRKLQSAVLAHAKSEEKEEFDRLAEDVSGAKLKEMRNEVASVEAGVLAGGKKA